MFGQNKHTGMQHLEIGIFKFYIGEKKQIGYIITSN